MPESVASSTQENRLSQQSMDMPMERQDDDLSCSTDLHVLCPESPGHCHNASLNSAKSVESLNTLLMSMPEISIPALVYNPLPLQCLAVSALPDQLRQEIDDVIAEYAVMSNASTECCSVLDESSIAQAVGVNLQEVHQSPMDHSTSNELPLGNGREGAVEAVEQCAVDAVEITWTVLKKQPTEYDDLGVGLKIMGGVKCDRCHKLHAVITSIFTSGENLHTDIKEGMCISQWGEHSLDGHSFEGVQRLLEADADMSEVRVGFMKCSDHFLSACKGRPSSDTVTASGTDRSWNAPSTQAQTSQKSPPTSKQPPAAAAEVNKRSSLPAVPVSVEPKTDDTSQPPRPSSLEVPPGHASSNEKLTERQQKSRSRSSSPARGGEKKANVTVPKLEFTAQALLAAIEAKPKSPRLAEDLQNIIDHLPNGMMQLSIKYDTDLADLSITLNQVKGQSLGDMFINTYLIPDIRHQGVRSVKVAGTNRTDSIPDGSATYMVTEDELSSVALRVILWDAKKSKNMTFRGEVLLGLSDDIVNLRGDPTWYNVCPVDPNLPRLPQPVHYKSKASHVSMEQLLNRFKSNFSTLKFKSSRSMMSQLDLTGSDSTFSLPIAAMKRRRSVPKGRLMLTHNSRPNSNGFQYAESTQGEGAGEASAETEEETQAHLMKLSGILKVLKDSAESDDAQSTDDTLDGGQKGTKKKTKLHSILKVLRDDSAPSGSESGDNVEDSTESTDGIHHLSIAPLDDGTFSTLDRRVRKRKQKNVEAGNTLRPKSDSFDMIPDLRDSLHGTGKSKVPTFSFLEERENSLNVQRLNSIESLDDDERSDATYAEHYKIVHDSQSDSDQEPHPPAQPSSLVGEASPSSSLPATLLSADKHSSVSYFPVDVSVHKISVVDVDDQEQRDKDAKRRYTVSLTSPDRKQERSLALNLSDESEPKRSNSSLKSRSRSLGDMEALESEEEVLLVRSPVTPGGELGATSNDNIDTGVPFPRGVEIEISASGESGDTPTREETRKESLTMSSLDFCSQLRPKRVSLLREDDSEERGEKVRTKADKNMSKWRSLDNLLSGTLPRKTKKNKKKQIGVAKASLNRMNSMPHDSAPGTIELELQYNDLNPLHPVLLVKLTDVIFYSSKGLSSEFTMKSYVYHRSTKVCVLKNKTNVNMKLSSTSAHLGLVQFETDITNLSLQVCLFTNSKLFSRKLIGEVWIELDSLSLCHDSPHTQWYSLTRQTLPA